MEQTVNTFCISILFTLESSKMGRSDATLCDINQTTSSRESLTGLVRQTIAGFDQEHEESNLS